MMSVMSTSNDGGVEFPSDREDGAAGEESAVASAITVGTAGSFSPSTVRPAEEAAPVPLADGDGSDETRVSDNVKDPGVLKLENEENRGSSSVSSNSKKSGSRVVKLDDRKNRGVLEDYDSILSAFDEFAAKGKGEAVGHGYAIGDMVWGKVKSHPWWPGHIYNEAFASPSVRRTKHEGNVLVAFFGDGSYGWFDPAELIPFEENFLEKSRQTMSRTFVKAVEEAVDELSRRRGLGLACRCRNEFNFWPSNVEGYYVVDVGDYEPGVYGLSQIKKARDSFQPREMLSFVQRLALEPMDQDQTIDFIKNKATALACRKAMFEEFDETYAQAFGTVPVHPPRPTAPAAVDPSKAPLSGPLVIAEALGKRKLSGKPAKSRDQLEKEKYQFKRRDVSLPMKSKKASSGQAGSSQLLLVDGPGFPENVIHSSIRERMPQASDSGITDRQHQPMSHQVTISSDSRPFESRKLVEGARKKTKVRKRPAGELSAENANLVEKKKKKKKGTRTDTVGKLKELPVAASTNAAVLDSVSGMQPHVPLTDNNGLDNQEEDAVVGCVSSQSQQTVDFGKLELQMLVNDLRALALNPFHGQERSCPAVVRQVFLKYRSLVYQKSLVLSPLVENSEASEGSNSSRSPAATASVGADKILKPSVRLDDPTKGGKKRGPSDRPEGFKKKKKLDAAEEIKKKKKVDTIDSGEPTKKKKIDDSKLLVTEKKILQRPTEPMKEIATKHLTPTLSKAVKLESNKQSVRAASNPTMLVMKFPSGAALPSGAELRAKFARFGPLDHSATRVFWKTYTCRLVYLYKADAQAALKFALGSSNLFGNSNVRSYLRDLGVEATESEPVKPQREEVSSAVELRKTPKVTALPLQHPPQSAQQLKSCLKKPSADEGGNGNGNGNGNGGGGRGARVKFVLGGEEQSSKGGEILFNENRNNKNNVASSFPEVPVDITASKISSKFIPQSLSSNTHSQKFPVNYSEQGPTRPFNAPHAPQPAPINDISQRMLNLLMRCNDVVNNLTGALGYVPYHPL